MFEYKVIAGIARPGPGDEPRYVFQLDDDPKGVYRGLEWVLNHLAKEDWEPWHMTLPTSFTILGGRQEDTPVTLVFRRKEGPEK